MGLDNPIHIFFVVLVVLLVFGAKRLPELGRSLGGGMRGFRDALSVEHDPAADGVGVAPASVPAELPAPAAAAAAPHRHCSRRTSSTRPDGRQLTLASTRPRRGRGRARPA